MHYNKAVNLMLENLNREQYNAATWPQNGGPLLVLAGAGTGKTRVLTTRIAYILSQKWAAAWQILALTFTNRAANEMRYRIGAIAGTDVDWRIGDLWCGTFHSICLRILRANYAAAGLRRDFLVFGEDDQRAVIKSIIGASTKTPAEYVEEFSRIKDKGLVALTTDNKIYAAYNAELARLGAVDFGDIILHVLVLFRDHPEILARYQNQFKYILVDEFQDTNAAQMEFLKQITAATAMPNICCVGDDDQSIYSWRGAEIKNILNFQKTFSGAEIIRLEQNYRSTGNILGAANSLIRHNTGRLGKELCPANNNPGEPVYILTLPSDFDEARIITDTILRDTTRNWREYAVLIRSGRGSLSRTLQETFTTNGIPYRLVGDTKFYERREIRDAIAYIRLMVYPFDDISLMRAIGAPKRGFGDAAIAKIRGAGVNLFDGLKHATLNAKQRAAADEFIAAMSFDWQSMPPRDAVQKLLDQCGYIKMWQSSKDADAPDRLENIRELITNVVPKYDTIPQFLEQAALMMTDDDDNPTDDKSNVVSIMTIHAAKGLEFNTVFLPAWENGIFPNEKSINDGTIEEERRLAYVAITRARKRCIITNAMSRMVFGSRQYNAQSEFIDEIDPRFVEFHGGAQQSHQYHNPTPTAKKRTHITHTSTVGKLVSHPEMGPGVVIEDNGDIATVAFKNRGIRRVAKSYLKFE